MYLIFTCRNKKCITLDLRQERGREILMELVKQSDVLVENFGVKGKQALGLDYNSLKEINPRIILASLSTFGQTGPYAQRLGFDPIAQAMAGIMYINGFPGEPVRAGVNVADFGSGVYAALGVMLALYHRQRTGQGQEVDVSLLDVAVTYLESIIAEYKVLGEVRPQLGNRNYFCYPYDVFKVKDGYVCFGVAGDGLWRRLLKVLGREDMAQDPRFQGDHRRVKNYHSIYPMLSEWVEGKTAAEVESILNDAGVPCCKVNTIPEVVDNPQVKANEMIVELEQPGIGPVPVTGVPIKLSLTPGKIETRAPLLGEHNEEIYCGLLGYSKEELQQLKQDGII
jgi:CoA:oxalate CoA-transferase